MKEILLMILTYIILMVISYLVSSFLAWDIDINNWGGFIRFLFLLSIFVNIGVSIQMTTD